MTKRTRLLWCIVAGGLVGLGFALDAVLPVQPRFMLRGEQAKGISHAILVADGKTIVAGTLGVDGNGEQVLSSLKSWDTVTGQERGEVFRGLVGADLDVDEIVKRNPKPVGFSFSHLSNSPDRRYFALMRPGAVALADLATGKEWQSVVTWSSEEQGPKKLFPIYPFTQQSIDTTALRKKMKLRAALDHISWLFAGKLPIRVDREAFVDLATDPCEEFVFMPVPADGAGQAYDDRGVLIKADPKMPVVEALRVLLPQVGNGDAAHIVRRDFIEITTSKRSVEMIQPPVFSPRGSFVVLSEWQRGESKLHVVECASGTLIASLSGYMEAPFQFTPDDELLLFFANGKQPLLTAWNTQTRQTAHTFADVGIGLHRNAVGELAPDGRSLLVNSAAIEGGGVDLLELRTGAKRRLIDHAGDLREMIEEQKERRHIVFARDSLTLVRLTAKEVQVWDLDAGRQIKTIKHERELPPLPRLTISADSRCCVVADRPGAPGSATFSAWNLDTGERVWQRKFDEAKMEFTPEHRFLIDCTSDRINILTLATGNPHASVFVRGAKPSAAKCTPDARSMVTLWGYEPREPGFAEKWLGKWWRVTRPTGCFVVADVATGRVLSRVDHRAGALHFPVLSDDGRTLLTQWTDESETTTICCWDVPTRTSRALVVGIPLAFGLAACGIAFARRPASATPQATSSV